jgi:hypothetical protein
MVAAALSYPPVCDEWATLKQLQAGKSIARLGDGELKMLHGRGYRRQVANLRLAAELRQVLLDPHPGCAVGIPTMDPKGPKFGNWQKHRASFAEVLAGSTVNYCSAFISRPDSAPWINCQAFAEGIVGLWSSRNVAVLCEPENTLLKLVKLSCRHLTHVTCPRYQAYDHIDVFEDLLLASSAEVAIMACGASATCLADRLTRKGMRALDLGSSGGFLMKLINASR